MTGSLAQTDKTLDSHPELADIGVVEMIANPLGVEKSLYALDCLVQVSSITMFS